MEKAVKKVDPRKRVEVSGFRLDPIGQSKPKSIQYSKSETYLTDLMDKICEHNGDRLNEFLMIFFIEFYRRKRQFFDSTPINFTENRC